MGNGYGDCDVVVLGYDAYNGRSCIHKIFYCRGVAYTVATRRSCAAQKNNAGSVHDRRNRLYQLE